MFLTANIVYRLAHMLHDVEAVVDDLVCRIGYVLNCSLEVRFPHVHGHGLDALELLRRELLVIILEAFGLAILRVVMGWSRPNKAGSIAYRKTYARRPSHEDRYHYWH